MKRKIIISLKDITVRFGETVALEHVHLSVHEGEIVSIVGPNGGGKTTLLNTILGLVIPHTGSIGVLGHTPHASDLKGDVGYLPQSNMYTHYFPVSSAEADRKAIDQLLKDHEEKWALEGNVFLIFLDSTHFNYSWSKDLRPQFTPISKGKTNFCLSNSSRRRLRFKIQR